ncbi:hypothetical protein IQ37_12925 [Chryseobacterium piperi]|uniref:Uncharacterized protein n=1 Tax=Chryseobacterium piperi TaxID=558152 RepID=A0A086B7U7_9FLAO|nr:hypothetical protein [Chryseobacterium piperi]ATL76025.1 hypothetical protein CJF12_07190 [Chryseobacterium piperi]KFF25011.1 hypothetical protein IQ37_12925 [Chryseobacterium piperi]
MKKIFYSFLLFSSVCIFGQKNPAVKFAVANDIVGTIDMFKDKSDFIQSMHVYKTPATLPQNLKKFSNIAENGFAEFKLKKGYENLDRITLSELNKQNNLPQDNPVIIEGYEFANTDTLVFGDILAKTEVKDYNGKKSLFISTTQK